jgi:hypothetical protein
MAKIKSIDLKKLRNNVVNNFSIWNHFMFEFLKFKI